MRLKNRIDISVFPTHDASAGVSFGDIEIPARVGFRSIEISANADLNEKISNMLTDGMILGDVMTAVSKMLFSFDDYTLLGDSATIRSDIRSGLGDYILLDDSAKMGFLMDSGLGDCILLDDSADMSINVRCRFSNMTGETFDTLKNMSFEDINFIN